MTDVMKKLETDHRLNQAELRESAPKPAPDDAPGHAPHDGFGDAQMDAIMGRLLQVGVLLASSVVLVGGMLFLRLHHATAPNYRHFSSNAAGLLAPTAMLHAVAAGNAIAIIQLGVLLLIATPIARVVFAAIAFAIERDLLYVAISLVILGVLMYGFFQPQ